MLFIMKIEENVLEIDVLMNNSLMSPAISPFSPLLFFLRNNYFSKTFRFSLVFLFKFKLRQWEETELKLRDFLQNLHNLSAEL